MPATIGRFPEFDLRLAWRRFKDDCKNRHFVTHPYLNTWIEFDLDGWLEALAARIAAGFNPSPAVPCPQPKPNWMLRPGRVLEPEDAVVYNALVQACYPQVWAALKRAQGDPDAAYQLRAPGSESEPWVKARFQAWREWSVRSLALINAGSTFVVFTDITAFYDNIELSLLRSDLSGLGVEPRCLDLLMRCLNKWAMPLGRGLPQGYTASDILAKVYVNSLDQGLKNDRYRHLRYVDDIRIFCADLLEAKRSVSRLTDLARPRGLNLQTAKTKILGAAEAKDKIDGVTVAIRGIQEQLRAELSLDPYSSTFDLEQALSATADSAPLVLLERVFVEAFVAPDPPDFSATLLHYLLTRLARQGSRIAVDYCVGLLAKRPEETRDALRHLQEVGITEQERNAVLAFIQSPEAIYDYQKFEVARWLWEIGQVDDEVLALARRWVRDRNSPPWLRDYALALLGKGGNNGDLETIENIYQQAGSDLERASLAAALQRMERGRRNSFYRRIENDGALTRRAVACAQREEAQQAGV
jgi:hypothetical protein